MEGQPTTRLERVTKRFALSPDGGSTAVEDVSLEVDPGQFVSVVGPSGCGKSTLLGMISGLLPPSAARILVEGEAVTGINRKLGYLFQRHALFPLGAEREKVDFGVGSAPGASVYIQVDLAKALGYFAEEGLDVNLQNFKGGAVAGAALVGGSTEVPANAIDHVIKAKQQGKGLRFIVSFTHLPGTPLVVNPKCRNEIKSPKDLRGRPVGVTAPGSATDLLVRCMMAKEGVRPEEMRIIGVGTNTIIPAIENDQVVAAAGVDRWASAPVKRGKAYLLVDLRTEKDTRAVFGDPYEFTGLLTRAEVIERRPAMIQKVVNALVKANRWMAANPIEKWADSLPAELVGDRAAWIESFKASKETFTADSLPTREAVMTVLRTFEAVMQIPDATKMDPDGLIDTRFVKKALEQK